MGCLKGCLALALVAACCLASIGVQISPPLSQLGRLVCDGRVELEEQGRKPGAAVWCVNEQTGRRHSIKALTVLIVSAAFFLAFLIPTVMIALQMERIGARTNQIMAQREAAALRTDAIVVAVDRGWNSNQRLRQIELYLTFQINDPYSQPYQARTPWMVREDRRHLVDPGQLVRVKVNPDYPQDVFPDVDWAVISDLRANFY